jgi:hypothetical protein
MVEGLDPYSPRTQPPQYGITEADLPRPRNVEPTAEEESAAAAAAVAAAESSPDGGRTETVSVEEKQLKETQTGRYVDTYA